MTLEQIKKHFHLHFPNVCFDKYASAVKIYKFSERLSFYQNKQELTTELCYLLIYSLHDLKIYFDATLTGKNNIALTKLDTKIVQQLELFLLKTTQAINKLFIASLQPSTATEALLIDILTVHENAIKLSLQLSQEHIKILYTQ